MEKPNLIYINQLARGDNSIKNELINIIKTEFPEEKKYYFESLQQNNFKKIAENVHRLKHKISIFGLSNSYKVAKEFEHNLREHSLERKQDFEKILIAITHYIETL